MKEPKYYFIYYNCKRYGWSQDRHGNWISSGCSDNNYQDITDKHPIQWQLDCNEKWGKEREEYGNKHREEYMVISWQTLTLEEYKKFKGHVG